MLHRVAVAGSAEDVTSADATPCCAVPYQRYRSGRYDSAGMEQRSRVLHQRWLHLLHCPLLQLDGALPTDDLVRRVITAL